MTSVEDLLTDESEALRLEPRACYDRALVGVLDDPEVLVYSYPAVIAAVMDYYGWDRDTAEEWVQFNTMGCKGEHFPVFLYPVGGS